MPQQPTRALYQLLQEHPAPIDLGGMTAEEFVRQMESPQVRQGVQQMIQDINANKNYPTINVTGYDFETNEYTPITADLPHIALPAFAPESPRAATPSPKKEQPKKEQPQYEPQPFVAESTGRLIPPLPEQKQPRSTVRAYAPVIRQGPIEETPPQFIWDDEQERLVTVPGEEIPQKAYPPVTTYLPAVGQASTSELPDIVVEAAGNLPAVQIPGKREEHFIGPIPQESVLKQFGREFLGEVTPPLAPRIEKFKEEIRPFGRAPTITGKVARGAGSLTGILLPFIAFGKGTNFILKGIPKYAKMIESIGKSRPILAKIADRGFRNFITFNMHGQLMLPSDSSVRQRIENVGQSSLMAAMFTGSGALNLAGKAGKVLTPVSLFGIGAGSDLGQSNIPTEDRIINGSLFLLLHYAMQGLGGKEREKKLDKALKDLGYTSEARNRIVKELSTKQELIEESAKNLKTQQELINEGKIPEKTTNVIARGKILGEKPQPKKIETPAEELERLFFTEQQKLKVYREQKNAGESTEKIELELQGIANRINELAEKPDLEIVQAKPPAEKRPQEKPSIEKRPQERPSIEKQPQEKQPADQPQLVQQQYKVKGKSYDLYRNPDGTFDLRPRGPKGIRQQWTEKQFERHQKQKQAGRRVAREQQKGKVKITDAQLEHSPALRMVAANVDKFQRGQLDPFKGVRTNINELIPKSRVLDNRRGDQMDNFPFDEMPLDFKEKYPHLRGEDGYVDQGGLLYEAARELQWLIEHPGKKLPTFDQRQKDWIAEQEKQFENLSEQERAELDKTDKEQRNFADVAAFFEEKAKNAEQRKEEQFIKDFGERLTERQPPAEEGRAGKDVSQPEGKIPPADQVGPRSRKAGQDIDKAREPSEAESFMVVEEGKRGPSQPEQPAREGAVESRAAVTENIKRLKAERDQIQKRIDRAGSRMREEQQRGLQGPARADQSDAFGGIQEAGAKRVKGLREDLGRVEEQIAKLEKKQKDLLSVEEASAMEDMFKGEGGFIRLKDPGSYDWVKNDKTYEQTKQRVAEWQQSDASLQKRWREFKHHYVATDANLRKELLKYGKAGEKVYHREILTRGAPARALNALDAIERDVFRKLDFRDKEALDNYRFYRRVVEIEKHYGEGEVKHPFEVTLQEAEQRLKEFRDQLPESVQNKVKDASQQIDKIFSDYLKKRLDEELIDTEAYETLREQYRYQPRKFIEHMDTKREYSFKGRKITNTDSGIEALEKGSTDALLMDTKFLLEQYIARTEGIIGHNRAAKALFEFGNEVPDNGIVTIPEPIGNTKAGALKYPNPPKGMTTVHAKIKGTVRNMWMPNEIAKDWVVRDPVIKTSTLNLFNTWSGNKIIKLMATGVNPGFAFTNVPRDIMHLWLVSGQYSSFLPKFLLWELPRDLTTVAGDVIKRKGRVKDFAEDGGMMNFLTYQGQLSRTSLGKKSRKGFGELERKLGWLNETSELWTRIALRERAMRKGYGPEDASAIARDYLDFQQKGSTSQVIDSFVPYFTASIAATRKVFQRAYEHPAEFTWKASQIGTLALGLYLNNVHRNPETWAAVSDQEKNNNWVITTPMFTINDNGEKEYYYFKVPKDQGQRIIAGFFEGIASNFIEGKKPAEQWFAQVRDMGPQIPGVGTPILGAITAYGLNKDWWLRSDVWKGQDLSPYLEYYKDTPDIYKNIGELSKNILGKEHSLSPVRTQRALQKIFTHGNVYTSAVGTGYKQLQLAMGAEVDDAQLAEFNKEAIAEMRPSRRFFRKTQPASYRAGEEVEQVNIDANDQKALMNRWVDGQVARIREGKMSIDKLEQNLQILPEAERSRLERRIERSINRKGRLPLIHHLLRIEDPESRAEYFHTKYQQMSAEKKRRILIELKTTKGIASERFRKHLMQIFSNE